MKYQKAPRKSSCISLLFLTPSPHEKKNKIFLKTAFYDSIMIIGRARRGERKKEEKKSWTQRGRQEGWRGLLYVVWLSQTSRVSLSFIPNEPSGFE